MIEEWKVIEGFENYEVSNLGRVKSNYGIGRFLKGGIISSGYYIVILTSNKISKGFLIHKLVANAFLDKKCNKGKIVVDHINDIKTDNRLENLQVITQRENACKTQGKYSSKYKGVSFVASRNKWLSQIRINNIVYNLGRFNTELEASNSYQNKLKTL
jgi:hypothetical protein